jgi:hypothetical protein
MQYVTHEQGTAPMTAKLSPKMQNLLDWFQTNKTLTVMTWGGVPQTSIPTGATIATLRGLVDRGYLTCGKGAFHFDTIYRIK